ncbi:hypothetical protein [Adlercreutzia sp. ZJ473]|uniref:hypothetical protein n=1 Tax=Adlercreutzia sp. ZJ473 TaxID=2722822 RepID=UPI001554E4FA|nr:hypothetical protein [Adlercreutzia sp. ZJ473]
MSAVRNRDGRRLDDFADIPDEKYGVGCVLSNGKIYCKYPDGAREIKGRQLGLDYERPVIAEAICLALETARRRAPSPLQGSASRVEVERGIQVEGTVVKADNDLADL